MFCPSTRRSIAVSRVARAVLPNMRRRHWNWNSSSSSLPPPSFPAWSDGGRRCSSSSSSESESPCSSPPFSSVRWPLSSTGLGLWQPLIDPQLPSLLHLPEVRRAVVRIAPPTGSETSAFASSSPADRLPLLDDLKRATDIFASLGSGGPEHAACLALLAETQVRYGLVAEATQTLKVLSQPAAVPSPISVATTLARAKTLWLAGEAADAKALCDSLLREGGTGDGPAEAWGVRFGSTGLSPLTEAAARTGQGAARLLRAESLDDAFSLRDPFRRVVKALERTHPRSVWLVLAYSNLGVAEAAYARLLQQHRPEADVPLDPALRAWRQGLTLLKSIPNKSPPPTGGGGGGAPTSAWKFALETRLLSNMAWALLLQPGDRDAVSRASEFAAQALKLYDENSSSAEGSGVPPWRDGFGRALALVATCYHRTGSAVTAEGLLQSAVSDFDGGAPNSGSPPPSHLLPPRALERIECCLRYADLCRDWDRRDADARFWQAQAENATNALPPMWRLQPTVVGSMWFWTPRL